MSRPLLSEGLGILANEATVWTFTTHNTNRYGGETIVSESSVSSIVNIHDIPLVPSTSEGSVVFAMPTIDSITVDFASSSSRSGVSESTSVGALKSISWIITYSEPTPTPSDSTYSIECSKFASGLGECPDSIASTVSVEGSVHTITLTDIPIIEGILTLTNGTDSFTPIDPSNHEH